MPRFKSRLGLVLIVLIVVCQLTLMSAQAQESLPETPAGQLLGQLIEAINDDDEKVRMEFWRAGFVANDEEAVEQRKQRTEQVRTRLGKISFKKLIDSD